MDVSNFPDNLKGNNTADIASLAVRGAQWKFYSTASIVIMQFVFGIILARLLPPKDFGIFGYTMIFVGLITIYAQAGIAPAIVQRQNLTVEHIKVAFILSLLMGTLATITLWMIAPIFTKDTETSVLRVISLTFFISGFGSVAGALLEKKINFRILFWIELFSYLVGQGIISVGLAMMGYGVWALVFGILIYILIRNLALIIIAPHPIGFLLEKRIVKELMHFGIGMSLARFANYGARNGDYFVIGKILQPEALGLYSRAFQLVTIPSSYFASLISSVLFPVYALVQNNKPKLKKGFYLSISIVSFVTFPMMIWLFIIASELIPFLYGTAWMGSVSSLKILCICGAFGSIYTLGDALARANGLVYAQMARHFIYALLVITGSLAGIKYGIEGVATAVSCAVFIMYLLMMQLSVKIINGTWFEVLRAQFPGILIGGYIAIISSIIVIVGDKHDISVTILFTAHTASFISGYLLAFALLPLDWLGEIPEFLINKCSSFFPKMFLEFLTRRLKVEDTVYSK